MCFVSVERSLGFDVDSNATCGCSLNTNNKKECNTVLVSMSEDKTEGGEVAPSANPEERPNLEDYKSKGKASGSASNTAKTTDFDSVTTVPTPEGDVQVETKLEIPVEDNKEDVKSEAKTPKVKKSSEEEPSITTVSKEELSQRSNEAQQNRSTAS